MKKFLFPSACAVAFSLMAGNGFAQNNNAVPGNEQPAYAEFTDQQLTGINLPASTKWTPVETVSNKALKEFTKAYKNASNTQWRRDRRIFMADFVVDGKKGKAALEKNGYFIYTIITGAESDLPAAERRLFLSNYVDYKIDVVKQVNTDHKTAWFVIGKKDKNIVIARVMDGAVEEMATFTNGYKTKLTKKGRIIIPG